MFALTRAFEGQSLDFRASFCSAFPFLFLFLSVFFSSFFTLPIGLSFLLSRLPRSIPPVLPPQSALPPLHQQLLPPLARPFAFPSLFSVLSGLPPLPSYTSQKSASCHQTRSSACAPAFASLFFSPKSRSVTSYLAMRSFLLFPSSTSSVCTEYTCVTSRAPETKANPINESAPKKEDRTPKKKTKKDKKRINATQKELQKSLKIQKNPASRLVSMQTRRDIQQSTKQS